jgi:hypothetical protein
MSTVTEKQPDYVLPTEQLELLKRIDELRKLKAMVGPGEGKVYREEVHARAHRAFADLAAARADKKIRELRAKLVGDQVVYLDDLEPFTPAELAAAIDAPTPAGYPDLISPRSQADDEARRQTIEDEIRKTEAELRKLEVTEELKRAKERVVELEASAKTNGSKKEAV